MRLFALAFALTAAPLAAAGQAAPPAAAAPAPTAAPEKLICTRERPLGSMVSVKRCVTAREQAEIEAGTQKVLDRRGARVGLDR